MARKVIFLFYLIGQGKHHNVVRGDKRCKGNLEVRECLQEFFRIKAYHVVAITVAPTQVLTKE